MSLLAFRSTETRSNARTKATTFGGDADYQARLIV
jgi:hypothetical protein